MDTSVEQKNPDRIWGGSFLWACSTFMVILVAFVGLRVFSGMDWVRTWDGWVVTLMFSFVSQVVIMFGIPLLSFWIYAKRRKKREPAFGDFTAKDLGRSFGFDKPSMRVIGFAFLLGFMAYFVNVFVGGVFHGILNLFGFRFGGSIESMDGGVGGLFIGFILIAVLPGLCEEVTHRGMLQKSFAAKMGVMRALLFSSILFGLMHLNITQVFFAAILGYIMGLAVVATRSLWVGVIMHFVNNAMVVYTAFGRDLGLPGVDFLPWLMTMGGGFGMILFLGIVVAFFFAIMHIIHMLARENFHKHHPTIEVDTTNMSKWGATKFFLDPVRHIAPEYRRVRMTVAETTMFYCVLFLGILTTAFTLVWGLL